MPASNSRAAAIHRPLIVPSPASSGFYGWNHTMPPLGIEPWRGKDELATAAAQRKVLVTIAASTQTPGANSAARNATKTVAGNLKHRLLELSLLQTCALLHPGHRAWRANTYDGIRCM